MTISGMSDTGEFPLGAAGNRGSFHNCNITKIVSQQQDDRLLPPVGDIKFASIAAICKRILKLFGT